MRRINLRCHRARQSHTFGWDSVRSITWTLLSVGAKHETKANPAGCTRTRLQPVLVGHPAGLATLLWTVHSAVGSTRPLSTADVTDTIVKSVPPRGETTARRRPSDVELNVSMSNDWSGPTQRPNSFMITDVPVLGPEVAP